jgi:hypothetical protein
MRVRKKTAPQLSVEGWSNSALSPVAVILQFKSIRVMNRVGEDESQWV